MTLAPYQRRFLFLDQLIRSYGRPHCCGHGVIESNGSLMRKPSGHCDGFRLRSDACEAGSGSSAAKTACKQSGLTVPVAGCHGDHHNSSVVAGQLHRRLEISPRCCLLAVMLSGSISTETQDSKLKNIVSHAKSAFDTDACGSPSRSEEREHGHVKRCELSDLS